MTQETATCPFLRPYTISIKDDDEEHVFKVYAVTPKDALKRAYRRMRESDTGAELAVLHGHPFQGNGMMCHHCAESRELHRT